jgi:hypothetical protein
MAREACRSARCYIGRPTDVCVRIAFRPSITARGWLRPGVGVRRGTYPSGRRENGLQRRGPGRMGTAVGRATPCGAPEAGTDTGADITHGDHLSKVVCR